MKARRQNAILAAFAPKYNEIALFSMSISVLMILFADENLRAQTFRFFFDDFDLHSGMFLLILGLGIFFSVYHVFTKRRKTRLQKILMLSFAVTVNVFSGGAAGIYHFVNAQGYLVLFPIWNLINSFILLAMLKFEIIDERNISDDDATMLQVIIATAVILATFYGTHYVYDLFWATSFSICVTFATSICGAIQWLNSPLNPERQTKHSKTRV